MMRSALTATAIAVSMCALSACGGAHTQAAQTVTVSSPTVANAAPAEVLSLTGLGAFEGRCPRGAHSWTLRFIVDRDAASDDVSYRVGAGARRRVTINPGDAVTFHLIPNATKTHEPRDRFVPPLGQAGRGLTKAMMVPTTAPLRITIYQATEPQTLVADVRLALTASGGGNGQCVLAGSSVHADTYLNSSN